MKEQTPGSQPPEGQQREALARYFLSSPPYAALSAAERVDFRRRLRQLGALEDQEVIAAAGCARPLALGNPTPLLQVTLTAAQRLAASAGQPLLIFPAREASFRFPAWLHPRLLRLALVDMLRAACLAAPHQAVWVRLQEQASCLTVTATAAAPIHDPTVAAVIQECARLHGGSLAQSEERIGFSCARAEDPAALPAAPPQEETAAQLCRDTLSPVWTGFYSWLPEPSGDIDEAGKSSPETSAPDAGAENP